MPKRDLYEFGTAVLDSDRAIPKNLVGPHKEPAGIRFNVYRNNVILGLSDALAASFPVIKKLVGEEFFRAMAKIYVRSHPAKTPLMMFYGTDFPAFLRQFAPAKHLAYLPDVATLELARRQAFHAADAIPVSVELLAALPENALQNTRLTLHPSVRLLASPYPIFSIWRFNSTADQSPLPAHGEDVLIARPFAEVEMHRLPAGAFAFLTALQTGHTLAESVSAGISTSADFDTTSQIGGLQQTNILIGTNS